MIRAFGRMVVVVVAIVALAGAARAVGLAVQDAGAQVGSLVTIAEFAYEPNAVQAPVGATVTWLNLDAAPHTVTSDGDAFGSDVLATGGAFGVTFDTPGIYAYHCLLHPSMTGTVEVAAP